MDGFPLRIRGESGVNLLFKSNVQLKTDFESEETIRKIEKVLEKNRKEIVEDYDKLTDDNLMACYEMYVSKLGNGVFQKRPSNQARTLTNGLQAFQTLDGLSKCKVLNEIQQLFRCDIDTAADLSSVKGSQDAGRIMINKNTVGKEMKYLINESVTGLFENRVEL